MMTFALKLFQEYWAAYYALKRLSKVNSRVNAITSNIPVFFQKSSVDHIVSSKMKHVK